MTHAETRSFFESLDWTKQNCVLSAETGRPSSVISQWRHRLGHPKVTKYSHLNRKDSIEAMLASGLDRKSVASQLGVSRQRVEQLLHPEKQKARYLAGKYTTSKPDTCDLCGKPGGLQRHHPDYSQPLRVTWLCVDCHGFADRLRRGADAVITQEMIDGVNWEHFSDGQLAKLWSVTATSIFQLRIKHSKPKFKRGWTAGSSTEIREWLQSHKDEIKGKHYRSFADELRKAVPSATLPAIRRVIKLDGINVSIDSSRLPIERFNGISPNWDLPNCYLALIYGCQPNVWANKRCMHLAGPAKWNTMGGFGGIHLKNPAFVEAISKEIAKGKEAGLTINEEYVWAKIKADRDNWQKRYSKRWPNSQQPIAA